MNAEIMRRLARELLDGDGARRRILVMAVDVESDDCGCARVHVAHVGALTDPADADVARTLLRREYDRRAGRPMATLLLELELTGRINPS